MDSEKTPDESCRGHRLPRTLLVDHAAALLGVSRRTVYNRIHEGRLKTILTRSGTQRVLLESLEALVRDIRGESKARGRSEAAKLTPRNHQWHLTRNLLLDPDVLPQLVRGDVRCVHRAIVIRGNA